MPQEIRTDLEELELTDEEQKMLSESDFQAVEGQEPPTEVPVEAPPKPQPPAEPVAPQQPQEKLVPLAALQEARREQRELRDRLAAMEELKRQVLEVKESLKPKQPVPTFEEDPFAAIKHKFEQMEQQQAQRDLVAQQLIQANVQQENVRKFSDFIVNDEMSFRQQTPDFEQAFNHLIGKRVAELNTLGIYDPMDVQAALQQDALRATTQALRVGKSPSQAIYELSKVYGYTPQAPQAQIQDTEQQSVQERPRDNQGRFAPVQEGIKANKTLQGATPSANPNVEALLAAEGDDFEKMWKEFFPESKNTIL